jgi:prepilin-type N-terminal cleavage/methylation domain-containing protein
MGRLHQGRGGFTLIELSIVLVVIGLIVGGILVGQNLIAAANARATITQIEKYNTAVNTFRGKYGYLPGDIKDPDASNFGFQPRGTGTGQGDGNGVIEGAGASNVTGEDQAGGETLMFWVDLSAAHLIDGGFSAASETGTFSATPTSTPSLSAFLPAAQLGNGNYIYVYSGGHWSGPVWASTSTNYFGLSAVTATNGSPSWPFSNPGLTVQQASAVDTKLDDGMPLSGRVIAAYVNGSANNNGYGSNDGAPTYVNPGGSSYLPTGVIAPSALTCYDNGDSTANPTNYSITTNGGTGVNCALSFGFQAGD